MKHYILSSSSGATGALPQTTLAGFGRITPPALPIKPAANTAASPRWLQRCFNAVCHAAGVTSAICRSRHRQHHRLHRVEFGGGYVCHCEKCGHASYVQR